jgi:hypothetical protein
VAGAVAHTKDQRDWLERLSRKRTKLEKSQGEKLNPVQVELQGQLCKSGLKVPLVFSTLPEDWGW